MKTISIVIPAYNEAENIPVIAGRIKTLFETLPYAYHIIFVNDGSSDQSAEVLAALSQSDEKVFFINLARNFGHQLALKSGIDVAKGDATINMDCDLQHPVEMIPTLIEAWEEGNDIVYTLREEDKKLSFFKRITSSGFYYILGKLSDVNLEEGAADFRLYDKKVQKVIADIKEKEPFLRGLFKWAGFKQKAISYKPEKRFAGQSKYTLKKMLKLALSGITAFSTKPLYTAIYVGFIFSLLSLLYIPYILYAFVNGLTVSGWVSIISLVVLMGGIQIMILGIIGIYIGKIFIETKVRPEYIIGDSKLP
jgi:polyisoprenyl-phosphate glycosyltransferase